jgi:nucleoside-diphosphate-sugar epimerase
VRQLSNAGHHVSCLVRQPLTPRLPNISVISGDLLDAQSLAIDKRGLGRFDVIFHLAAMLQRYGADSDARIIEANTLATIRLIEAAERGASDRFVYMSSIAVIGHPSGGTPITEMHPVGPRDLYALGKFGGELACNLARTRGLHATAFRLSSPYGPGMTTTTVLPLFVDRALSGNELRWHGSGLRSQDFIHVDDVAIAFISAMEGKTPGLYNLGSGTATSSRTLAETIALSVPGCIAKASGETDPQDHLSWKLEMSAAKRDLGFVPRIALDAGIAEYISFRKARLAPWQWWQ